MKRIVLSALAASMLALPALQAEAAPVSAAQPSAQFVAYKDYGDRARVVRKKVVKKKVVKERRWHRGERYGDWRRHRAVDWRRHHLHRPGPGQQWIRVGNDYLLVSIVSGVIAGMIAAH